MKPVVAPAIRIAVIAAFLLPPSPTALAQPYRQRDTIEALNHPLIPQEVPNGLKVRYRVGRHGPFVSKENLNGQFDRIAETASLTEKEGQPLERIAAVRELARYPGEKSLHTLILALRDCNPNVREHAAIALGDFGDARAVPWLIDMLGYSDFRRAAVAARALEKITHVHDLGDSLAAWEDWYDAYKRWPHGVGTPKPK